MLNPQAFLGLSFKGSAAPRLISAAGPPGQRYSCLPLVMKSESSLVSLELSPSFLQETFATTGITQCTFPLEQNRI